MKYNLIHLFFALMLFWVVSSCEEDYEVPNAGSKHSIVFSSEADFGNQVQVNAPISFGDVSAGVESREWILPEGKAYILGTDEATKSGAESIKVIFTEPGTHEVQLHQEFDGTFYVGTTEYTGSYDTAISVVVLDSVAVGFKAYYINADGSIGEELVLANGAENEVTASRSVRFVLMVEGTPQEIIWSFGGGDPAGMEYDVSQVLSGAAEETEVKYKKIGTFDVQLIGRRDRPFGGDTLAFSNLIKVIPSTDPVTLDAVRDKGEMIALEFSREIDPKSVSASDFSVTIENDGTITPTISAATVDPAEGNVVLLELEGEKLYNDDVVKVSYTPGSLQTTDLVKSEAFTDQVLSFVTSENILAANTSTVQYDFEASVNGDANWPYQWWGAPWDAYTLAVGNERSHSGSKSARVTIESGGGMIISNQEGADMLTFAVEGGKTYEIGVWLYVESLGNIDNNGGELPNLIFFYTPGTNWGTGRFNFTPQTPVGEWFYARVTFEKFGADATISPLIRGSNPSATSSGDLVFYMDDWTISEVELRE
uniref:MS108 n=1 Tax=Microscilla sp. PRE1 TaxID=155537 RepID=Q93PC1_9BACT|nr:hypothetical protein [Microscilla sp. PRE1]AAK62830.1 MS108 [Microscilla sp. PRE1]